MVYLSDARRSHEGLLDLQPIGRPSHATPGLTPSHTLPPCSRTLAHATPALTPSRHRTPLCTDRKLVCAPPPDTVRTHHRIPNHRTPPPSLPPSQPRTLLTPLHVASSCTRLRPAQSHPHSRTLTVAPTPHMLFAPWHPCTLSRTPCSLTTPSPSHTRLTIVHTVRLLRSTFRVRSPISHPLASLGHYLTHTTTVPPISCSLFPLFTPLL